MKELGKKTKNFS